MERAAAAHQTRQALVTQFMQKVFRIILGAALVGLVLYAADLATRDCRLAPYVYDDCMWVCSALTWVCLQAVCCAWWLWNPSELFSSWFCTLPSGIYFPFGE